MSVELECCYFGPERVLISADSVFPSSEGGSLRETVAPPLGVRVQDALPLGERWVVDGRITVQVPSAEIRKQMQKVWWEARVGEFRRACISVAVGGGFLASAAVVTYGMALPFLVSYTTLLACVGGALVSVGSLFSLFGWRASRQVTLWSQDMRQQAVQVACERALVAERGFLYAYDSDCKRRAILTPSEIRELFVRYVVDFYRGLSGSNRETVAWLSQFLQGNPLTPEFFDYAIGRENLERDTPWLERYREIRMGVHKVVERYHLKRQAARCTWQTVKAPVWVMRERALQQVRDAAEQQQRVLAAEHEPLSAEEGVDLVSLRQERANKERDCLVARRQQEGRVYDAYLPLDVAIAVGEGVQLSAIRQEKGVELAPLREKGEQFVRDVLCIWCPALLNQVPSAPPP